MKYKNTKIVDINDIERGDVIVYQHPVTGDERRGIIYSDFRTQNEDGTYRRTGFTVVPVTTIGRGKKADAPYSLLENDAASVVEQAGGNPDLQKLLIHMNLSRVVNVSAMTGVNEAGKFRVIGSYNGSPLMAEIMKEVETLYRAQKLFRDGKPVTTDQKLTIVPPVAALRDAKDNSAARRGAYDDMRDQSSTAPLSSVVEEARRQKMAAISAIPLSEAFKNGAISHSTMSFLGDAKVPGTERAPTTLGEAYRIVTEARDTLALIDGLKSKGKIYQRLIAEVSAPFTPSEPG